MSRSRPRNRKPRFPSAPWRGHPVAAVALACGLGLIASCARDGADSIPIVTPQDAKVGRHGAWLAPAGGAPPNVLLITLDTTRRDHLSCYRSDASPPTPHLDALAADGILFERAASPVPVTLPAHATILTGIWPYRHGVRNNGTYVLSPAQQTLAEALRDRGYATGAILGAFPVAAQFGLDQGFETYDDRFPLTSVARESDTAQRRAAEVTRLGLDWLGEPRQRPFFLWLHYFDPHFPYDPPEPFRSANPGDPYAGEVAYMDAEIGRLLEGLRAAGQLERTAVLVAGDHGESRGEHRERTHSLFVYGATQWVPLLLRLPEESPWSDSRWRGRRVAELVSLADVFPTVLNLLGVPDGERPLGHGRSLLPIVAGQGPGHAWIYLETLVTRLEYGLADLRAIQTARWKYIRAPREELYDLSRDPGELQNLAAKEPEVTRALAAALDEILQQDVGTEAGQVSMDRETVEKLRSLGYVAAGAMPAPEGELPDPKDRIEALDRIDYARALAADHRAAQALALIDSVLAGHPTDPTALRIRGSLLVRLGRGEEAIEVYDRIIASCRGRCPDEFELQRNRAMAALAAGRLEDARTRARALAASEPDQPGVFLLLGRILERSGDLAGARAALEEQIRRTPRDAMSLVGLAEVEAAGGNRRAAEASYRRALEMNPASVDALVGLGELLLGEGRGTIARGYFDQALAADPGQPWALFRKAWFLRQDGRRDEAQRYYRLALERDPANPTILYNLGNILLEKGELAGALELYNAAARVSPPSAGLLLNLGIACARLGRVGEARAAWRQALAANPSGPEAEQLRRNLQALERRP